MQRINFLKGMLEHLRKHPDTYKKMILKIEKELENVYRAEGRAI
jgi:hypothetical protein|nr:MAG TPA: hypothetical protein [Caudoviricetes sp.]